MRVGCSLWMCRIPQHPPASCRASAARQHNRPLPVFLFASFFFLFLLFFCFLFINRMEDAIRSIRYRNDARDAQHPRHLWLSATHRRAVTGLKKKEKKKGNRSDRLKEKQLFSIRADDARDARHPWHPWHPKGTDRVSRWDAATVEKKKNEESRRCASRASLASEVGIFVIPTAMTAPGGHRMSPIFWG